MKYKYAKTLTIHFQFPIASYKIHEKQAQTVFSGFVQQGTFMGTLVPKNLIRAIRDQHNYQFYKKIAMSI